MKQIMIFHMKKKVLLVHNFYQIGGGEHTVGEWVYREGFKAGLRVSLELIMTEGGLM